ncbi:MAG TPA: C40 family peptidase [Rhodanobacter sp.]|nr:C40 family peptidase [Rhodanobacter sp.]
MPLQRLIVLAAFAPVLLLSGALHATGTSNAADQVISMQVAARVAAPLLQPLPTFSPAVRLGQSVLPDSADALLAQVAPADDGMVDQADSEPSPAARVATRNITDLRKALLAAAMSLRDIRYVRGGHNPSTGFDCSGFVRYVFSHAIGLQLPNTSASQFLAGVKVTREDIRPGDLVFFHTRGRHHISHVGIYISNGRFIHSPTTGKSVEISSLDDGYWAKRFAGAKRPAAMALAANRG